MGKYTELPDAYISVSEALKHAGLHHRVDVKVRWIGAEHFERVEPEEVGPRARGRGRGPRSRWLRLPGRGGHDPRDSLGPRAARPYLGLCLGLQCAVIEFGRMALGTDDANSSEFNVFTEHPVIDLMPDQADVTEKGGTMRLGLYPARLEEDSLTRAAYGAEVVYERHRHRFEVNNAYRERLGEAGMRWSGVSPDDRLVEFIELRDHPWFVATQAHPELKSRPNHPRCSATSSAPQPAGSACRPPASERCRVAEPATGRRRATTRAKAASSAASAES